MGIEDLMQVFDTHGQLLPCLPEPRPRPRGDDCLFTPEALLKDATAHPS